MAHEAYALVGTQGQFGVSRAKDDMHLITSRSIEICSAHLTNDTIYHPFSDIIPWLGHGSKRHIWVRGILLSCINNASGANATMITGPSHIGEVVRQRAIDYDIRPTAIRIIPITLVQNSF